MILSQLRRNRGGFTLVEIMIVVAIIALLAAIAVPNFMRARKRTQATMIMSDLRVLDDAFTLMFTEQDRQNLLDENEDLLTILRRYIKKDTRLYNMPVQDFMGNYVYGEITGNSEIQVGISSATFNELSDVAPVEFWSPYLVEGFTSAPVESF